VRLSLAAVPGMIERRDGAIINVASMLAYSGTLPPDPLPRRAIYAGAKSFEVTFTQTLAGELAGTGVRVMVCCPGVVKTEFHEVQGMDFSHLPRSNAEDIVTAALAGLAAGEVVCVPTLEDAGAVERVNEASRAVFGVQRGSPPQPGPLPIASRYRRGSGNP
jgi:short-subunit dehydrogenase